MVGFLKWTSISIWLTETSAYVLHPVEQPAKHFQEAKETPQMFLTQKDAEEVLFGVSSFDSERFDAAERSKGGTLPAATSALLHPLSSESDVCLRRECEKRHC